MNRRGAERFRLGIPILAQWIDPAGDVRDASGMTRDICVGGVFLMSSQQPPESAQVTVEVTIPGTEKGEEEMHLSSQGRVVRVEQNKLGYAVQCDFSTAFLVHLKTLGASERSA